jgi:uncharacterized membrane protein YfhO
MNPKYTTDGLQLPGPTYLYIDRNHKTLLLKITLIKNFYLSYYLMIFICRFAIQNNRLHYNYSYGLKMTAQGM